MSIRRRSGWLLAALVCVTLAWAPQAQASLKRFAAGSRNMGDAGRMVLDTAAEWEREPDGQIWTAETGLQYQASARLQLLLEGTLLETQRPRVGSTVSGFGDVEATLSWLAIHARGWRPSAVLGTRLKLPTASRSELGSRKADYSALFVLSHESDVLELNLETEYVFFGQPGGIRLENQLLYTLGAEYSLGDLLALYGEVFGSSRPTARDTRSDAARIGIELDIPAREGIAPYLSLETSTESVTVGRAGIEWSW